MTDAVRCPSCNKHKSTDEFGSNASRANGLNAYCKLCHARRQNAYYHTHKKLSGKYRQQTKLCPGCKLVKTRQEFGEKYGSIRDKCKECAAKEAKDWRDTHPEERRARKRRAYHNNPEPHKLAAAEWNNTERGKILAKIHMRVRRAIARGQLIRGEICEFCGVKCITQAAHEDYAQWLIVKWLCRPCHAKWDHDQPKSLYVVELGL